MTHADHEGTFEGRSFPSENEWLELQLSHDAEGTLLADDFIDRTMAALCAPTPEVLAAFGPPPPSADFVTHTLAALRTDRRQRWRELLARYVAPEPSPEFVARTLRALAEDSASGSTFGPTFGPAFGSASASASASARRSSWLRPWAMPLLAAAAVVAAAVVFSGGNTAPRAPLEVRATRVIPAALGPAHAPSPLPALLVALDRDADPYALPNSGGDGIWLLSQGGGR